MIGAEGGARWCKLGISPINSFDVFELKPGAQYHFRVVIIPIFIMEKQLFDSTVRIFF